MFEKPAFDDFASKLGKAIPESVRAAQEDVGKTVRAGMQGAMQRLDLVSREEFEVQTAVLARTREKLEQMEMRVRMLEEQLGIAKSTSSADASPNESGN
ncbi:accessory factor UbiK family protein [Acidihalobacter prosperus]|uniref:Ubiquinone biosynthesis accessory factor UbiK n=1 Tax=Acidihalobacter prosperus TaxID=160660 RepID=A0A1A6C425_9GAMM|nr:accessory factor UbiK family protein [Acidihalobacter prosperus]OBS09313.1 hypothetical protein Thpro_021641 [Acidihalobacter prosperus]